MVCRVVGFEGELVFDATKPDGTPRKLLDVSKLAADGLDGLDPASKKASARRMQDFLDTRTRRLQQTAGRRGVSTRALRRGLCATRATYQGRQENDSVGHDLS